MRAYRKANNLPEPATGQRNRGGRQGGDPSAKCRMDHGVPRRPEELRRFPSCTPNLRCDEPRHDLTAPRRPTPSLGPVGAKITNIPEANRFLTRDYRAGWEL